MLGYTVCLFALVIAVRDVSGSIAEELSETTQLCCAQGTSYAKSHSSEDCSSSIPPEVPVQYSSLCVFAMDHCCKEYFLKKRDCDSGIEMATNNQTCSSEKGSKKDCCSECYNGILAGNIAQTCIGTARGNSAEDLLFLDAYTQCCQKASKEAKVPSTPKTPKAVTLSRKYAGEDVTSLCEDYAPNELCAHHCIPVPGSYKCECNPGFMLMPDGRNCKEVVKNRCKPRNPCQHKCNDNGVAVKCSCRRGYQLQEDGKSCKDIDECVLEPYVCLPGTRCHNTQGSYKCIPVKKERKEEKGQCPSGFSWNIIFNACDDINECQLPRPPCPSYLCTNTMGGYKCGGKSGDPANLANNRQKSVEDRCPPGFKSGVDEECEDVDECATQKDDCNPISQFCINTRGSFYCQDKVSKHCPPGFKIDTVTNKCEDINECEEEDVCRIDQVCVNLPGEYDCRTKEDKSKNPQKCPEGFRMRPGSQVCEDIDECVEGTHICDLYQNCLNTNGSHECTCKLGFELDRTTGACTDVNECAKNTDECMRDTQRCDNTVGSYFCVRIVSCGTGYILHHSSGQCEDIDECELGTHNCAHAGPEYKCQNVQGSFRCVRQHSSTTSTTPAPEYEYEYYDSEEEIETNKTSPEVESKPTTTTTEKPAPSEAPSPKPESRPIPTEPTPERPTTPDTRPIPDTQPTVPIPTEVTQKEREQKVPEIPSQPVKPVDQPRQPEPTPVEPQSPYYYETSRQPEDPKTDLRNNEVQPSPEPQPSSPEPEVKPEENASPHVIFVSVGPETATVKAAKTDDGAVVVRTEDVPKNEWTKIDVKPSDCQIGFQMDEFGACFDIDECATNKHSCSGLTEVCRNIMGSYICDCAPGFRRDLISGVCDLITSSSSSTTSTTTPVPTTPTPTTSPTTPLITSTVDSRKTFFWGYPDTKSVQSRPFRPRNLCDSGFHLNTKTGICEDINECTNGQANCAAVEICINTEGGYRCECPPNWKLDDIRHRCVPIRSQGKFPPGYKNQPVYHPASPDSAVSHGTKGTKFVEPELTNLGDRGSVIKCPWGYRLGDDNTCEDIDECLTGEAKCSPIQICTNLPGGYTCSCPQGHRLIGDHECEDVDECEATGSVPICSQNSDCINTVGSYQCSCHNGFRPAPANDRVCMDVDECMESRAGELCQQRCNNVWGGYRCSCHRGYRINADNSTCADVDECTEFKSKVVCVGRCHNEPGSYRCSCPQGYRLSEDKRSCIDINECETGEASCANGGTYGGISDVCVNTRGSFRCHRITCPPGYRLEGKHRCTKIDTVCPPSDWECAHQPSTYSYNYITFVSKLYIPESKVDLFTMKGPSWPYAKMKFELRLVNVNAPPTVKDRADVNSFLLLQTGHQAVVSLVRSLEGPQSLELELSMELYNYEQFGGIAVAKIFIHVSEYEY